MRSPQPLLVPLLVLTLLAGGFLAAHLAARRRAAVHPSFRSVAKGLVAVGLILLGLGVALLFGYAVIGDWAYYPLSTPLILAAGGTLAAYGITTIRWMDKRAEDTSVRSAFAGPAVLISLWLAVAASLFWATATLAQWSGRGLAKEQARNFGELPSVIVDSKQRLFLPAGTGVAERDLTGEADGQAFRYRYWNLRLLIHGRDGCSWFPPPGTRTTRRCSFNSTANMPGVPVPQRPALILSRRFVPKQRHRDWFAGENRRRAEPGFDLCLGGYEQPE